MHGDYPLDFSEQKKINLRFQLKYFELDVHNDSKLQNLSSIAKLCQGLVETEKSNTYHLIDRLICHVLTLLVFTMTTKQTFSTMKVVKTKLRNKMENEFLTNSLVVYIESEIVESFNLDSILEDFVSRRGRKLNF
jgi:hypothetical protein